MRIVLLILLVVLGFTVQAQQTGAVRGFVYDKESGEPVIFTNVVLKGTSYGAATDVNGQYTITKIPVGQYTLFISSIGYDSLQFNITITNNKIISKNLFLEEGNVEFEDFILTGEKEEAQNQVQMSVQKITPKQIKQIPTIGGDADLAQYLQVLPGVVFTGDQGGQLYIRGGSPIQNKVLLDGMIIYNPFHSIGLFSVFDTDVIRNADVYTGGFNAKYGGRISSIMDITTVDGNKKEFEGKASASTFGAKLLLQGPLKKLDDKGSSITYVASAKTSYLQESSKLFYTYIDSAGLPFNFTDLYGKISFGGGNGNKFNVFGFNFDDQVKYQAVSDLNWKAKGAGANFVLVPSNSPTLVEGSFNFSNYFIGLKEENVADRSSNINGFSLGLDFTYFAGDNEWKYGLQVLGFKTQFEYFNEIGRKIDQTENTTELAGYLSYKIKAGLLVLEPNIRLQYYASLAEPSFEPRLGAKYNINENFRLKGAVGKYSQNLISATSDRDVVNLFYGFLSGPDNLQDEFTEQDGTTTKVTSALQLSTHYIFGFELDLSRKINVNIEGYHKSFDQLTNINRNKIFEDSPENADKPDVLKKDFIIETGYAQGVDFVFKYDNKTTYFWAVYSLGYVRRWDGIQEYAPVFDRRHNINLVASQQFGKKTKESKKRSWEINFRWNLGSGLPFTQTVGFFEQPTTSDGSGSDIITNNGDLQTRFGDLNGGRLPTYHRFDVGFKKTIEFNKRTTFEINGGATNIYNRENIFYIDRVKDERVNQLPFMPSLGFNLTF